MQACYGGCTEWLVPQTPSLHLLPHLQGVSLSLWVRGQPDLQAPTYTLGSGMEEGRKRGDWSLGASSLCVAEKAPVSCLQLWPLPPASHLTWEWAAEALVCSPSQLVPPCQARLFHLQGTESPAASNLSKKGF